MHLLGRLCIGRLKLHYGTTFNKADVRTLFLVYMRTCKRQVPALEFSDGYLVSNLLSSVYTTCNSFHRKDPLDQAPYHTDPLS